MAPVVRGVCAAARAAPGRPRRKKRPARAVSPYGSPTGSAPKIARKTSDYSVAAGSLPEPAVPAYRRLRMPRKRPQVLGSVLNRSELAPHAGLRPLLSSTQTHHSVGNRPLHCEMSTRLKSAPGHSRHSRHPGVSGSPPKADIRPVLAFMSTRPSTTLADLFRPPLVADPFSTVRASLRR